MRIGKTLALKQVFTSMRFCVVITLSLLAYFVFLKPITATSTYSIYWHPTSDDLPSDIQTLAAASTTLCAGSWGQGVYRTTDHGATWITATTGLTLPMYIKSGLAVNPVTL